MFGVWCFSEVNPLKGHGDSREKTADSTEHHRVLSPCGHHPVSPCDPLHYEIPPAAPVGRKGEGRGLSAWVVLEESVLE